MAKYKYVPVDIYKRGIHIFIGSRTELRRWANKYFEDDKEYRDLIELINETEVKSEAAVFWYNKSTGDGIIEIPKFPYTSKEIAYCTHECLHATCNLLDFVGVEYVPNGSNESFTYLLEHFVYNLLNKDTYKTA